MPVGPEHLKKIHDRHTWLKQSDWLLKIVNSQSACLKASIAQNYAKEIGPEFELGLSQYRAGTTTTRAQLLCILGLSCCAYLSLRISCLNDIWRI